MRRQTALILAIALISAPSLWAKKAVVSQYQEGINFYKSGRRGDALQAFEQAIKNKDNIADSRKYIDLIRKESVDEAVGLHIKGIDKSRWQSPFYYMNKIEGRIRIGLSIQAIFDRDSLNFRPGAVEALKEVASALRHSGDEFIADIDVISEVPQEKFDDPQLMGQQLAFIYSFLSNAQRIDPRPVSTDNKSLTKA